MLNFIFIEWTEWQAWTLDEPECANFTERRIRTCEKDVDLDGMTWKETVPSDCDPYNLDILHHDGVTRPVSIGGVLWRVNFTDIPCLSKNQYTFLNQPYYTWVFLGSV